MFPIRLEPETDPGSKCGDYNTLCPWVFPPLSSGCGLDWHFLARSDDF